MEWDPSPIRIRRRHQPTTTTLCNSPAERSHSQTPLGLLPDKFTGGEASNQLYLVLPVNPVFPPLCGH